MDNPEFEVLLNEYERAQDVAQHSDAVFWEITSIIWGANTLMLGFVLEAIQEEKAKWLIGATALVGVVLSILVVATYYSSKIGQRIAFQVCQQIENRLPTSLRLHNQIDSQYPKGFIRCVVWLVTIVFLSAWAAVGFVAKGWFGLVTVAGAALFVGFVVLVFWI